MANFNLNEKTLKNMSWFDDYMKSTGSKPSKGSGFLSAIGSLHPLLGVGTNILQNILNRKSIVDNNRLQERLTLESNLQAKQEAEKAYQRSRPISQVNEMRLAGMSEQGAINALNGGGSYSPAPINTAQTEASQMDLSGIVNVMQHAADMAEQKRQFDEQMKLEREKMSEQSRQFEKTHNLETSKFEETANQNAALRNLWHEESEVKKIEKQLHQLRLDIELAGKEDTISANKAEALARDAKALLEAFKAKTAKAAWESLDPQTIHTLANIQATLEVMSNFGTASLQKITSWIHDVLDSLPFS